MEKKDRGHREKKYAVGIKYEFRILFLKKCDMKTLHFELNAAFRAASEESLIYCLKNNLTSFFACHHWASLKLLRLELVDTSTCDSQTSVGTYLES